MSNHSDMATNVATMKTNLEAFVTAWQLYAVAYKAARDAGYATVRGRAAVDVIEAQFAPDRLMLIFERRLRQLGFTGVLDATNAQVPAIDEIAAAIAAVNASIAT